MLRCSVCGEIIGVYEPVIVVGDGHGRTTSLARRPQLADDERMIHGACRPRNLATCADLPVARRPPDA